METLITVLLFTIFIAYAVYIEIKTNFRLGSISESYYELDQKWLFQLWTFTMAGLLMWLAGVVNSGLLFAGASGFCFVGAAAAYKRKVTDVAHYTGALMIIIPSIIYVSLQVHWYFVVALALSTIAIIFMPIKRKVYWIEIAAFILIMLGLFML